MSAGAGRVARAPVFLGKPSLPGGSRAHPHLCLGRWCGGRGTAGKGWLGQSQAVRPRLFRKPSPRDPNHPGSSNDSGSRGQEDMVFPKSWPPL